MTRRTWLFAGLGAVLAAAGAFHLFADPSYVLRFTGQDLSERLARKLPLTRSYLALFDVTLDHPRVTLEEGSDRVRAALDVTVKLRPGHDAKSLSGSVEASGGVRYQPESGQFRVTDPRVEQLAIRGLPEKLAPKLSAVLQKALAEYYAEHPVYTLKPADTRHAAAKLLLKAVTVRDQTLVVTLGI